MSYDFSQITEVKLAEGAHSSPSDGLCFMEMAAWFAGEKHGDKPECSCPVLGAYGIRLNDEMPHDVRDRLLKPMVPLIVGTRDKASEVKRADFLAMWATNKILPVILRQSGFEQEAIACEKATNLSQAKDAADAAAATAYAAYGAAYAADAAAAAATAAYDAAYAADAAAATAATAADAATAEEIWTLAVEGLRQAILIGRHDGFGVTDAILSERHIALREMVAA